MGRDTYDSEYRPWCVSTRFDKRTVDCRHGVNWVSFLGFIRVLLPRYILVVGESFYDSV